VQLQKLKQLKQKMTVNETSGSRSTGRLLQTNSKLLNVYRSVCKMLCIQLTCMLEPLSMFDYSVTWRVF